VLRIFVYSLLLANILLIALRLLYPDYGKTEEPVRVTLPAKKLPTIELVRDLPATEMAGDPSISNPAGTTGTETPEDRPETAADSRFLEQQPMACIQVGPFENEASMAELKAELSTLFDRVESHEKRSIVDRGYWVYLPKYASRAEAEQAVNDLTAVGAREFYIMPDGAMANAISLGVYDRREGAEERRQQLNDLGVTLDIMIEPRTEIRTQFWMEAGPVSALSPTLIELSFNNPDIQQLQVDCSITQPRVETGMEMEDLATGPTEPDAITEQN
jgi:hypothetical protein